MAKQIQLPKRTVSDTLRTTYAVTGILFLVLTTAVKVGPVELFNMAYSKVMKQVGGEKK